MHNGPGETCYVITLAGAMDDLPVALFCTRSGVDAFIEANRPAPVDGGDAVQDGPLLAARNTAGYGPSIVFGYSVWEFTGGAPTGRWRRRWIDGQWPGPTEYERMTPYKQTELEIEEFNEPWNGPCPHDGDHVGGGPVG